MKMKKIASLALCLALAAGMMAGMFTAAATVPAPTVSVRIEGAEATLFYDAAVIYSGGTVLELLGELLTQEGIEYQVSDGYITKIGADEAGRFGGWDGWVYYVNGRDGAVGMAEATLEAGDSLLLCYTDAYGTPPTLMPELSVSPEIIDGKAVFTFTASVTTFDAEWNPTVSTVAVADANVVIDGAEYKTDENGVVAVDRGLLYKDEVSVQISKHDENGKPLVIRFAPDFKAVLPFNKLSFTDVSASAWYRGFVVELVNRGAVNGYTDGTFKADRDITRAEYIKILAMTDADYIHDSTAFQPYFSDVTEGAWYAPYLVWAVDKGIVEKGGAFNPNAYLARQDMALMAYNYSVGVLKIQLPADGDAPAFDDDADIAEACKEAVYLLQKAGVINGMGGNLFVPKGTANRGQACKVIVSLLNLK